MFVFDSTVTNELGSLLVLPMPRVNVIKPLSNSGSIVCWLSSPRSQRVSSHICNANLERKSTVFENILEHVSIVYFFHFSVVYFSGEAGVPILTNDILVHDITPARTPVVAEQRIGGRGSCGYSALRLYVQV